MAADIKMWWVSGTIRETRSGSPGPARRAWACEESLGLWVSSLKRAGTRSPRTSASGSQASAAHPPAGPAEDGAAEPRWTLTPPALSPPPGAAGPIGARHGRASRGAGQSQTATTLERLAAAGGRGAVAALA